VGIIRIKKGGCQIGKNKQQGNKGYALPPGPLSKRVNVMSEQYSVWRGGKFLRSRYNRDSRGTLLLVVERGTAEKSKVKS
jgi:hypothetical protein